MTHVSHLTEDELVAWRDNTIDDDSGVVEAHLAECATCAAAYDSLLQSPRITELELPEELALATPDALYFEPADRTAPTYVFQRDPRTAAKPFGPYAWRAWASIIAVVAVVTTLMALIPTPTSDGIAAMRLNGTLELLAADPAAGPSPKISWRNNGIEATQYQVVLKDDAGLVVFGLVTAASNASLPAEILGRLQPERTYTWTVTALDASAKPKASTSRSFSLAGLAR